MSRQALTPFDADAIVAQRGWSADITIDETHSLEPKPTMLSQIIQGLPPESTIAPERSHGPGTAKPLSNHEKWQLSELAQVTYGVLKKAGQIPEGETVNAFRQRIAIQACARRISQATHGDRMLIQAAFLKLKGEAQAAARATVKATTTALDIARHKLWEKVHELKLSPNYAEGISRRIFKRDICALTTDKQVWAIFYTLVNNANAAAGKGNKANRFKSLKAKREASKKGKSL